MPCLNIRLDPNCCALRVSWNSFLPFYQFDSVTIEPFPHLLKVFNFWWFKIDSPIFSPASEHSYKTYTTCALRSFRRRRCYVNLLRCKTRVIIVSIISLPPSCSWHLTAELTDLDILQISRFHDKFLLHC